MSRIAVFQPSLAGGGAERVMLYLARGFVEQGLEVDLVLVTSGGPYMSLIPPGVRVVDLKAKRLLQCVPALIQYLRQAQPTALLSAFEDHNMVALCSRKLAGVSTRIVVSVHNTMSLESRNSKQLKRRIAPFLASRIYPWADAIVPVSQGSAADLIDLGFSPEQIKVIYNPVVTPELFKKAVEAVNHPWLTPGQPPVILAVGRLEKQKDFPTLIKAFAEVRKQRLARLMILGEGNERTALEALIQELGLGADVALPGFVDNPYAYMAKSAVFVLSSLYEGLPTVLIEAIAVGTPVVSTDCKSGPAEILNDGRYGKLAPVGDFQALATAIVSTLEAPSDSVVLQQRATEFSLEKAVTQYLQVLQVS